MERWLPSLASSFRRFVPGGPARRIRVYPVSLGPNEVALEYWSSFYALGCLVAYAKVHRGGALLERFEFGRITPAGAGAIPIAVAQVPKEPAVFLLSSYVWNQAANVAFARALKQRLPGSLVIVGGPHVPRAQPLCEAFFAQHPYIDVAVRAEGEVTLAEILRTIGEAGDPAHLVDTDLSGVEGLTFRRGRELVRTGDRAREIDLSVFPSPYLTGEFEHWITGKEYVPLETNRGCPYGCTFCDWGAATLAKLGRMSMDRVLGEIEYAARHQVKIIGFCDANFGILPRDVDIAKFVLEMKARYGFPQEVGYTNAKTASTRLTDIIKLWTDGGLISGGQISMQTTDDTVLDNVKRSNIKMSEYRKMITFFHKEGIPAVSDIMLGLPGQTFETCKKDLQFCFDHKVVAMIFATSVMPNAPMADAEYRRKFQIEISDDGFVESTYSFTREEYARMFDLCLAYKLFVKLGVLKYLLYFVQVEHGVRAMDVLERWLVLTATQPGRYPISARVRRDLLERDRRGGLKDWLSIVWTDAQGGFLFDNMEAFQAEILALVEDEWGVHLEGSDVEAVLIANREVMPRKGRQAPREVPLPHDVAGYFAALRALPSVDERPEPRVPLHAHGPGVVSLAGVTEPASYDFADIISLVGKLELASNVRI